MNLSWIDDFMVLAATGNFSRAAEERHMTQPAFSRRIRALEEWLGADLFDRSSQPARLTEVGEWFRTVAQDLQSRVARIPGDARAVAEAASSTLRFAATHALSFTFLPRWLGALETLAPMGPIRLVSDVQQQCELLLAQSSVHFVLSHAHQSVRGTLDEAAYRSVVVGTDRLIAVSAPNPNGKPMHRVSTSSKGTTVQILGYSGESGLGRILRGLKGAAVDRVQTNNVMTAHLASVLRTMALAGRGLAWLPELLIHDDLAAGRLVVAAPDEWHIKLEIRLYRPATGIGRAAEAFWDSAVVASRTT